MDIGRIKRNRKSEENQNIEEEQNIYGDFEKKTIEVNEMNNNINDDNSNDLHTFHQEKEYKTGTLEEHTVKTTSNKISRFLLFGFYLMFILIGVVVYFMLRADKYEFYLKKDEVNIFTGSTYQVELIPKNIRYFDYLNYNYSISDTNVATVDEFGTITAVGPGTATLTISLSPGFTKKTMKIHSESIALEKISLMMYKDEKYQAGDSVNLSPGESIGLKAIANDREDLNTTVTYTSSNPSVATVDEFGNVTAKSDGTATISAVRDGIEGKLNVTVKQGGSGSSSGKVIQNISFSPDAITVKKGSSVQLVVNVTPKELASSSFTWTSSDTNIATVNGSGLVKANSNGKTTITAKSSNGLIANCSITVTDEEIKISKISLNSSKATIYVNGTYQLNASISPATATLRNIVWSSSNPNVATVNNGTVKGVGEGTAIITAANDDGSVKVTSTITVKKYVPTPTSGGGKIEKISLGIGQTTQYVGNALQLSATVTPRTATGYKITWTSNDTNVATVNENGLVISKKEGTVVITAMVDGVKANCTILVKNKGSATPTSTPTKTPTQAPTQAPTGTAPVNTLNPKYVAVSTQSLTVKKGETVTFKVKANNAAGVFAISSSNTGIAKVDKDSLWLDGVDEDSGKPYWAEKTVTVTGVAAGTTKIVVIPDPEQGAASYDIKPGTTDELISITGKAEINITVK